MTSGLSYSIVKELISLPHRAVGQAIFVKIACTPLIHRI